MRRTSGWLLTGLVCVLGAFGCQSLAPQPACPPALASETSAETLPVVARGNLEAVLLGPVVSASFDPPQQSAKTYRGLTPEQCASLAANASSLANLYRLEEQASPDSHHRPQRPRRVQQDVLKFVSLEARNRSAGDALETYYNLAKAEAGDDLLVQSLAAVQVAVRKTEDIVKEKLRSAVELEVWQRQKLKLQTEQVRVRNSIEQLNGQLHSQLGLADAPGSSLWPEIGYAEFPEVTDVTGAVAVALAERADLRMLRGLARDLDAETLSAIRPVLQVVSPLMGAGPATSHPVLMMLRTLMPAGPVREREVTVRRQQIEQLLRDRERAVANEARQAAHDLNAHRRLADLARQQAASWKSKLDDLERRGGKGLASFAEITSARLEWLKARGDVVAELIAVRVADVKLKQAQSFWGREESASCAPPEETLLPEATWSSINGRRAGG